MSKLSCSNPESTAAGTPNRRARRAARKTQVLRPTSRRGPLPRPAVVADDVSLTRFAGMVPLIRYMTEVLRVPERLKAAWGVDLAQRRVHAVYLVLHAFVVGSLVGVERMAHLEWLRDDVVLLKFLRLSSWPVRKVFTAALALASDACTRTVEALVGELGLDDIKGRKTVNCDVDNSAIVSYGEAEDAHFGYCGKGRRRKRHYPIVASLAENRAVVMTEYRDGSEMKAKDHVAFFLAALGRIRKYAADGVHVTFRGDSGFWSAELAAALIAEAASFFFALPLLPGLKLMLMNVKFEALTDDEDIEFARLGSGSLGLSSTDLYVVVVRRRVHDPKAPPQGKVINWSPEWRYQAIITNEDWSAPDIWRFYNYRAECERVFRIGKQALGMGHLVGHGFRANRMAFLLRVLAYNIDIRFQRYCEDRARDAGAPVRRVGLEWRQIRFYLSPGRFAREAHHWVLHVPINAKLEELWSFYAPDLMRPPAAALAA